MERDYTNLEPLTKREIEVLSLVKENLENKEIAKILEISPHTVKAHISAILRKFKAKNRFEAVLVGIKTGYITI